MAFLKFKPLLRGYVSRRKQILIQSRFIQSYKNDNKNPTSTELETHEDILVKLEKSSLIGLSSEHSLQILESAVKFAERLRVVEIGDDVKPMYSPLEEYNIPLRDDKVSQVHSRQEILKNATVTEEEYFVTPTKKIT